MDGIYSSQYSPWLIVLGWIAAWLFLSRPVRQWWRISVPTVEPDPRAPRTVVLLVHGTWARNAAWTHPGSSIRTVIERCAPGPVLFLRVAWGGRNQFGSRQQATKSIERDLAHLRNYYPSSKFLVIAHSHGGNAALQAISSLKRRLNFQPSLICLSTPFLLASRYDLPLAGFQAGRWMMSILLFAMTLTLWRVILSHARSITSLGWLNIPDTNHEIIYLFFSIIVHLAPPIIGWLLAIRFVQRQVRNQSIAILKLTRSAQGLAPKTLILRQPGDEATTAIGAVTIVAWPIERLARILVGLVSDRLQIRKSGDLWLHALWMFTAIAALNLLLSGHLISREQFGLHFLTGLLFELPLYVVSVLLMSLVHTALIAALLGCVVIFFLIIAAVLLLSSSILHSLATGFKFMFAGVALRVWAEHSPWGNWSVRQLTPTNLVAPNSIRSRSVLADVSHSRTYASPSALREIDDFVRNTFNPNDA